MSKHDKTPVPVHVTKIVDIVNLDGKGLSAKFKSRLTKHKPLEEFYADGGSAQTPSWILGRMLEKLCETKADRVFAGIIAKAYFDFQSQRHFEKLHTTLQALTFGEFVDSER